MRRIALLFLTLTAFASGAHAQDPNSALSERLDRLERDVNFVQKQVYRSGSSSDSGSSSGAPANSGQLQVRVSQIDEEIRQIRGLIEQVQFQNKQTATELKKLSDDVDYRLRAIEQKQAEAAAAPVAAPAPAEAAAEPAPAAYEPADPKKPAAPAVALTGKDFPDANAHYTHAFKLLNDKKYAEAGASFDAFVKKYPADPLTANAYYWLGESQYARADYTRSTESFRKGFEVNPDGQKAPDNLYKLAMSLSQIKRKSEACVVLSQVSAKYAETSARTAAKAKESAATLQCPAK